MLYTANYNKAFQQLMEHICDVNTGSIKNTPLKITPNF